MIDYYKCRTCRAMIRNGSRHKFCSGQLIEHLELDRRQSKRINRRTSMRRKLVQLAKRDGYYCACCGKTNNLTVDHMLPLSRGGTNRIQNLQILCEGCNADKADQTMDEWKAST